MAFCEYVAIFQNILFNTLLDKFRTNLFLLREDKFIYFERGKSFNIMKIIMQTKNAYLSDKLNIYTHI